MPARWIRTAGRILACVWVGSLIFSLRILCVCQIPELSAKLTKVIGGIRMPFVSGTNTRSGVHSRCGHEWSRAEHATSYDMLSLSLSQEDTATRLVDRFDRFIARSWLGRAWSLGEHAPVLPRDAEGQAQVLRQEEEMEQIWTEAKRMQQEWNEGKTGKEKNAKLTTTTNTDATTASATIPTNSNDTTR
jgi:hypothetical protein